MSHEALRQKISDLTGVQIQKLKNVPGGSTFQSWRAIAEERSFFCKIADSLNKNEPHDYFEVEAKSLKYLAAYQIFRIPAVVKVTERSLIMEFVPSKKNPSQEDRRLFFANLARLHQVSRKEQCGLDFDTYIGKTPQVNAGWHDSWADFYLSFRLKPLLEKTNALWTQHGKMKLVDKFLSKARELLEKREEELDGYSLLHGDLWGRNHFFTQDGEVVLFDPAIYFGDPLADLALTNLFQSIHPGLYLAYNEHTDHPVHYESKHRTLWRLYQIYHLLNHTFLFGESYSEWTSREMEAIAYG